ncbi:cobyrinic acid a,c-diamide synthase [Cellvibrio zantedeschiae]|uniref:Cobyrinic acid a,c-diamide synthase n=1 Tax=Cellvibrio zantedeschiae TaxID=1237077 RepID=A0ABQ3B570_9GAMM|nr:ParA family protein [Cellvibrio zantedeschiae]GGY79700.1 cobyrinic acid a,c-diamide synthase [Cellvibrio zantedeschiae]
MPAKTYGITCTKGGVGKTTTTANTGALLADMGQRVLLIDADPQQSLSRLYQLQQKANFGLTQLYRNANAEGCISKTVYSNLDIVINDDPGGDSGAISTFLRESITHFQHLFYAIEGIRNQYDYILIDTQGAKGIIQETVIFAADVLLSPVQPKVLDGREFIHGTVTLINKFKPRPGFTSITGRALPPVKVLFSQWDRNSDSESVSRYLRAEFDKEVDGQVTVLNTIIPRLKVYAESSLGTPVHRLEQTRPGSTLPALQTMLDLIYELEPKLIGIEPEWNGMNAKRVQGEATNV